MPKIQERVEQYVEDWVVTSMERRAFYEILRSAVEECCEKAGEPLSLQQRLAIRNRIEKHFAWLEAK